jgi:ATP-dependent Clp protease, protease subunit
MGNHNLNPIFFEKTKDGDRIYDVSSRLVKNRVIYLDCEIDPEITSQITSLLWLLDTENNEEPITLWINSPGGMVEGFCAIYDMMNRIKAPVKTVCIGEACSASAILLAAGSSGFRFAMPNSRIMIHQIQIDGLGGSNAEVEIGTKEIKKLQETLMEILARHTGHTKAKIKRDTKMDYYMSAEEAVSYGLVDNVLPSNKKIPELKKRENIKSDEVSEISSLGRDGDSGVSAGTENDT